MRPDDVRTQDDAPYRGRCMNCRYVTLIVVVIDYKRPKEHYCGPCWTSLTGTIPRRTPGHVPHRPVTR